MTLRRSKLANRYVSVTVDIGNPPQRVTVLVDTGSSELWVNPDCRTAKSRDQAEQCVKFGKYDPRKSQNAIGPFGKEQLNYGDPSDPKTQTSATIYYYADAIALGGAKISNQTFGVVSQSKGQSQGIIGLAPDLKGGFDTNEPYTLVLSSMAEQGVIASRVFALDLRHADNQYGAVIYGGLDQSKFIGTLEKRPIVKGVGGEWRLGVELTTIGVTLSSPSSFKVAGADANVMLDSGTTITRMHSAVAQPILEALGAQDDGEGYYQVPCSMKSSAGSVDFGFGNKTIRVPFKDFILDLGGSSSTCYVGMVLTTDQQILGDSVLRAGYFVFDWDNQEVHIAQAANCGKNNIVAVSSGKSAVPSVTGSCKEGDAVFTGGTTVRITNIDVAYLAMYMMFSPQQANNSQATRTKGSAPTKAYTTVYTITSCPAIDPSCQTGVVTTRTIQAAATGGGSGGDGDSAGVRANSVSGVLAVLGALVTVYNVL